MGALGLMRGEAVGVDSREMGVKRKLAASSEYFAVNVVARGSADDPRISSADDHAHPTLVARK